MLDMKERKEAITALKGGVETIKTILARDISKSTSLLQVFLDSGVAYAVDIETDEVIWMNEGAEKEFPDAIGKKCYEAFQGLGHNCKFCKVDKAMLQPNKPYWWIHKNLLNNKVYFVEDTFLPNGINGFHKPAHFERAIDITELLEQINER